MLTNENDFERIFGAMGLIRSQIGRLYSELDKMFGAEYGFRVVGGSPKTNLYDKGDHLEIRAEVEGMTRDDITVKIRGNFLELSGARKPVLPKGYNTHVLEREITTSFIRSFTLPFDVDTEKVVATLKDGILFLILPKLVSSQPKEITIS